MDKTDALIGSPVHDLYRLEVSDVLRSMIGAAAVLAAVLAAILTLSGFALPEQDSKYPPAKPGALSC